MKHDLHGFVVTPKKTIFGLVANIILAFVLIVYEWTEPKSHFILFHVLVVMACVELI